ncbi:hypothetical protein ACROYT_G044264 [Oculina patagonica]
MEKFYVSMNIGPPIKDTVTCQLSDSDHIQHPGDLKPLEGFRYRGTDNSCSSNPCLNGTCLNGFSDKKYICVCRPGYTGDQCEKDANECATGTHNCSFNAICNNTEGSYNCSCKDGFLGDGRNCVSAYNPVFTNLGVSGRNGPTSLGSHYTGQAQDGQVTVSGGIQRWTVPETGNYRIEAVGAAGGYDVYGNSAQYRGRGARMIGTFSLTAGEIIQILVGQEEGINTFGHASGGGGGTFVLKGDNTPLIIAGGGGGVEAPYARHAGCDASTSTAGNPGYQAWSGGINGKGADISDGQGSGGGGGGFYSSGRSSSHFGGSGYGGEGGRGFLQGGVGGRARNNDPDGGFGGGGGAYGSGGGGGGGGGYSGGSSGNGANDGCGGGGGSYNAGTNQQNECCYKSSGHGQVTITSL